MRDPTRRATILLSVIVAPLIRGQEDGRTNKAVLLMNNGGSASHVSRDGKYLLYTDWNSNQLAVRDLSAGADRQLTRGGANGGTEYPADAAISPDNKLVSYNWSTPETLELRLLLLSGSGEPRRISTGDRLAWLKGWTPDGKQLLVVEGNSLEGGGDLGFIVVDSGKFRRIGSAQPLSHARLSPDGAQIVLDELSAEDPTRRDIRLIDVETGRSRLLLSGSSDDYSPEWAPDGKRILFISDRDARPRLWELQLRGEQPRALLDLPDGALSIVGVTSRGRVVVNAGDIGGSDSYSGTVDWSAGRVVDVQLLKNPPFKGSRRPVPSPHGTMVAFVRKGRGFWVRPGWQIPVVHSFRTGLDRTYPTALTLRDAPIWYPDEAGLLFPMPPEGAVGDSPMRVWRFVRLDLQTGKYAEVGKTDANGLVRMAGMTTLSLFYLLGGKRVMALDWKTGANQEVFRWAGEGQVTDAAVLGEAERVAFAVFGKPASISIAEPGKEPVRIAQIQANGRPQLVWAADKKSVLVSGALAGKQGVWRIPVAGGAPQRLDLDQPGINEVRLSEDGTRIAFTQRIERPSEVWAYSVVPAQDP